MDRWNGEGQREKKVENVGREEGREEGRKTEILLLARCTSGEEWRWALELKAAFLRTLLPPRLEERAGWRREEKGATGERDLREGLGISFWILLRYSDTYALMSSRCTWEREIPWVSRDRTYPRDTFEKLYGMFFLPLYHVSAPMANSSDARSIYSRRKGEEARDNFWIIDDRK